MIDTIEVIRLFTKFVLVRLNVSEQKRNRIANDEEEKSKREKRLLTMRSTSIE